MDDKFDLSGLSHIFSEAIKRNEPTLAFELANGRGRFLFMMFFDKEDESTKDQLFVFMKNTSRMVMLKMYGNHFRGQFYIFLKEYVKEWFKDELALDHNDSNNRFDFNKFFESLNSCIPIKLSLQNKINKLRESWSDIKDKLPNEIVDESDKTILIGDVRLPPNKKPREKTLRKLYLYADGNADDITTLINTLKRLNRTVAWTHDTTKGSKNVLNILGSM